VEAVLEVRNVTKRYGPSRGVQNISFSVGRGEVLGLLGPNGAGKTTTLRVITGFLPASAGRVRVEGHDLWEEPYEVRRRIGYLPDNPPLYPEMTVYDYLAFMAELHELPRARLAPRIDEVAERLQLGDVLGRLIGRLSRGYRQRVGLAQAVLHEPPVLICDEPTVGLDPAQIVEMRELIRSFGREHAVVFSSHILSEVKLLCSEVVIIRGGEVLTQGAPSELTARLHGGAEQWLVRVKGPAEAVAAALGKVRGVRAVRPDAAPAAAPGSPPGEQGSDGVCALRVEADPGAASDELSDRIFDALAAGGWRAREMRKLETSLEEVFLELTAAEHATAPDAEPALAGGGRRGGKRR
jgi:ABC-2 type transport system ATP-binding protein